MLTAAEMRLAEIVMNGSSEPQETIRVCSTHTHCFLEIQNYSIRKPVYGCLHHRVERDFSKGQEEMCFNAELV